MRPVRIVGTVLRTFGWKGLERRGVHEIRRRLGLFRTTSRHVMRDAHYSGPALYRCRGDLATLPTEQVARIVMRARKVSAGLYEAYGHDWRMLPQTDAQWRTHPEMGYEFPTDHWWTIDHLPSGADIKDVWEPARFGWVYDLVRAHAIAPDPSYAQFFYQRFASWAAANPPFRGVHWACGQEIAIRCLALLHAMDSLPPPAGAERSAHQELLQVFASSGERIADAINYGLSQRNNHGLSESAGLLHLGLRLQGLHPRAQDWIARGKRLLEEQIHDQFYADGWYAQHSFTYMRFALEQALLAQWVMQMHGMSLSHSALHRLRGSFELLVCLVDEVTGYVPNHGANDGGRAAPLAAAEYRDFRPTITQAALILGLPLPADVAPEPQTVLWFGGVPPTGGPRRPNGVWKGRAGWAVARVGRTMVFLRAGSYRHRPSHLDALHLDVSFEHCEAISDPGTFAYNAAPPWRNALASAAVHNGPLLDDAEPGERGPRFLWYSWPSARLLQATYEEGRARLSGELEGRVRRDVEVTAHGVRVLDGVLDPKVKRVQVTWLLNPHAPQLQIDVEDADVEHLQASEQSVNAWFSPSYGLRQRAQALRVRRLRHGATLDVRTLIRPRAASDFEGT